MQYIYFLLITCLAPVLTHARQLTVKNSTKDVLLIEFDQHRDMLCIQPGEEVTTRTAVCDLFGFMKVWRADDMRTCAARVFGNKRPSERDKDADKAVMADHGQKISITPFLSKTDFEHSQIARMYPIHYLAGSSIGLDQDYAEITQDSTGKTIVNLKWVGGHAPCVS